VTVTIERPDDRRVVAHLREGDVRTEVTGWRPEQSAADLMAAIEAAQLEGYGECFWPEPTGQYWWMLRLKDRRLEVAVMWSSGVGTGWQHVFRAADEIEYLSNLIRIELVGAGLLE
jgi:hypothetical protein